MVQPLRSGDYSSPKRNRLKWSTSISRQPVELALQTDRLAGEQKERQAVEASGAVMSSAGTRYGTGCALGAASTRYSAGRGEKQTGCIGSGNQT